MASYLIISLAKKGPEASGPLLHLALVLCN
jgi:hypothetical protein